MIYGRVAMSNSKSKKNGTVMTTYDLCLECKKACKCIGPPWRKLECPSFSSKKFKVYKIVDMTDSELLRRIAYA
jgi:hypothetical protein